MAFGAQDTETSVKQVGQNKHLKGDGPLPLSTRLLPCKKKKKKARAAKSSNFTLYIQNFICMWNIPNVLLEVIF